MIAGAARVLASFRRIDGAEEPDREVGKALDPALKGIAMPTGLLPPIGIRTDNKSAVMEEKAAVTRANRLLFWPTVSQRGQARDAFPASNKVR